MNGRDRPTEREEQAAAAARKQSLRKVIAARLWWLLAYASLGIGIVGIFVPVLPTTVFVLLSAYAAARGSTRLHRWLLRHRVFGPAIIDWQAHGAVSRRAKWSATLAMLGCALILLGIMLCFPAHRWWMTALPIACMTIVGLWLWRRPEPRER